jgi:Phage head completion protein (GPL)
MTDHVSIIAPPLQTAIPPNPASNIILADGWFPGVSQSDLKANFAIDQTITEARLKTAIYAAMETALLDLREWKIVQVEAGFANLAAVPADNINGESRLVRAWHRAIGSLTKAEIVETSRDYDATGAGERSLSALDEAIQQSRRDGAHAISDILGTNRTMCELI